MQKSSGMPAKHIQKSKTKAIVYASELVAARDNFDRKLIEVKQEYDNRANELMSTTDSVPGVPGIDFFDTGNPTTPRQLDR